MGSTAQDLKNASKGRPGRFAADSKQSPAEIVAELDAKFIGYVNYNPTEADKEFFNEWVQTADLTGILDRLGDDGYKIGIGYDEKNKTYLCSITSRRASLPNAGYVLSLRANSASKALSRALFVHAAVAGEYWERLLGDDEDKW